MRNHKFIFYSFGGNHTAMSYGSHSFLSESRQTCRYCNEYKGSQLEFNHNKETITIPYCSKKCFYEDGNDLNSNIYTKYVDEWIKSGERDKAIQLSKIKDKEYIEKRELEEQKEESKKRTKSKNNRILRLILLLTVIAVIVYYFFLYNPYTEEQMINACDCHENSYEKTRVRGDNLSPSNQSRRIYCFDLFKPKDFDLMKDDLNEIDKNMMKACEKSR